MTVHRYSRVMQNMQSILREYRESIKPDITRGRGAGRVLQTVALAEQRSREFGQVEEAADTLASLCVAGEGWRQLAAFCREHRGAF